jgi:two-component system NarL family sensor kinase
VSDSALEIFEAKNVLVAASLADEIAPLMTLARYVIGDAVQRLRYGVDKDVMDALQTAAERVRIAAERTLAIASELRPRALDDLGLLPALAAHCREFEHRNRQIVMTRHIGLTEGDVPGTLKPTIYRIVQTALEHVERESAAGVVRVGITLAGDCISVVVENNGTGFATQEGSRLLLIRRWVESSSGRCAFESTPMRGSRVQARWRLPPKGPSEAISPA